MFDRDLSRAILLQIDEALDNILQANPSFSLLFQYST